MAAAWLILLMLRWPEASAEASVVGEDQSGSWELLLNSTGVVAMHMTLTHLNTVVFYDQTSSGRTGYRFRPARTCNGTDSSSHVNQCWAHSMEYDVATNTLRPLTLWTDTWCSSGAFLTDGVLQQAGGYGTGSRRVRYFQPCSNGSCDWVESAALLADRRWYATSQILPDGGTQGGRDRVLIVGGLKTHTYEFVPKSHPAETSYSLPFLRKTLESHSKGNNLYPFVHLSPDGNLFIFANRDSILFDYHRGAVVRSFPRLPGRFSRNYPSSGSSTLLPLRHSNSFQLAEVLICGGADAGAYKAARRGRFLQSASSCGRMTVTDYQPQWSMENMPGPRVMSDMLVLPTGDVLIINGASRGCAGWQMAADPALAPYLYRPNGVRGQRFSTLHPSEIPRMYHSAALLLPDGRVLVAGSNPYYRYNFSGHPYRTELRMEAFTPYYMEKTLDSRRPHNLRVMNLDGLEGAAIGYEEEFVVLFEMGSAAATVEFAAIAVPFVTHSNAMHQRVLMLECRRMGPGLKERAIRAVVMAPPSSAVAPAGYYMFSVVNGGIPSKSVWVRFGAKMS